MELKRPIIGEESEISLYSSIGGCHSMTLHKAFREPTLKVAVGACEDNVLSRGQTLSSQAPTVSRVDGHLFIARSCPRLNSLRIKRT